MTEGCRACEQLRLDVTSNSYRMIRWAQPLHNQSRFGVEAEVEFVEVCQHLSGGIRQIYEY